MELENLLKDFRSTTTIAPILPKLPFSIKFFIKKLLVETFGTLAFCVHTLYELTKSAHGKYPHLTILSSPARCSILKIEYVLNIVFDSQIKLEFAMQIVQLLHAH